MVRKGINAEVNFDAIDIYYQKKIGTTTITRKHVYLVYMLLKLSK